MEPMRVKTFLQAVFCVAAPLSVLMLILLCQSCSAEPRLATAPVKAKTVERDEPMDHLGLPYPECRPCLRWLHEHLRGHRSVEVLQWKRNLTESGVFIVAQYEVVSQAGGTWQEIREWQIQGGEVVSTLRRNDLFAINP